MRNLLIFILILVAIWWIRRALRRLGGPGTNAPRGTRRSLGEAERMLACRHCGIHVPESEGVHEGDAFYCCEEHRRLGARR